ncbi:hypothetical protein TVAG_485340 [Trichomonas vaginalis G3]|uniref:Uncharacterized protein n=1 Tax=Trichomonas vaginalis (strain ATCC PRA-98 / G3) TaxID=412133 RepID=A2EZ50_TRIV3|nr:hypothetical protein TVAGG3_0754470 [Trichomonas vaginalis G3]EAY02099.1 hypothetical protein TVAG_485340 [Trichomonas vaginalis G3]KAI5512768.1 hypothetical protein TVAGG3_0754470 [Trichomonas vaginalis G3]|eukprot:XP_001330854.1 hypothetical protein [Trichomonas vaginalis G3]
MQYEYLSDYQRPIFLYRGLITFKLNNISKMQLGYCSGFAIESDVDFPIDIGEGNISYINLVDLYSWGTIVEFKNINGTIKYININHCRDEYAEDLRYFNLVNSKIKCQYLAVYNCYNDFKWDGIYIYSYSSDTSILMVENYYLQESYVVDKNWATDRINESTSFLTTYFDDFARIKLISDYNKITGMVDASYPYFRKKFSIFRNRRRQFYIGCPKVCLAQT